jgi:heme/copper-type cytochrome/quinol oxidase subunit 3
VSVQETVAPPAARRHDAMPPALLGVILFVASECIFFDALFGAYFTVLAQATVWPTKGI